MSEYVNVVEIFGENVFNDAVMQARLPKKVYKELKQTMEEGKELTLEIADVVAHEMKEWAIEKGATHYSHWFQPLTGVTAEKHDAFITAPKADGKVLMSFSGKELIKGEPDASSFPSGGLRATFEARGYTAWIVLHRRLCAGCCRCNPLHPNSILFIYRRSTGSENSTASLHGGHQQRSPSSDPIVRQYYFQKSDPICWCGTGVFPGRCGKIYEEKRSDLYRKNLFGAMPPKGQELDDHYFGTIRQKIAGYMKDVNEELWKLGVSSKTQHNEVAPAQHELAPIYAPANIAVDHNQIIMQTLKRVARRHGLKCILHEKPFAGVNGSGKHDNWSLVTDDGINLLEPGKTPHENVQFLLVLSCILKAVDRHADLLRESASDVGNDHRLAQTRLRRLSSPSIWANSWKMW